MRKLVGKAARKALPGLYEEKDRLKRMEEQLNDFKVQLNQIEGSVNQHDRRLDTLRAATHRPEVEPYQPLYGVSGIIDAPRRSSLDRCRTIEKALGDISGLRMLDIGSSLGYVCFYMADHGAMAEGWESNIHNAEASRLVGEVNGIDVTFKTTELNLETVRTIQPNQFDVVFVLNVFHHITRFQGLAASKELCKELLDRVPVLIVELARKGEDPKLPWDKSQPENELDIVKGLDVEITKLGDFGNHLSDKKRPLYMISRRKQLLVNGKRYAYEHMTQHAYEGSLVAYRGVRRRYYTGEKVFIKEYYFDAKSKKDNLSQIMNEMSFLLMLQRKGMTIHHLPELVDFELQKDRAALVLDRIEGTLALDDEAPKVSAKKVAADLLRTLAELESLGLHHNDIRSWNVMLNAKGAWLIDYGAVAGLELEDNKIAFLWTLHAILTGQREGWEENKKNLPPEAPFKTAQLDGIYKKASSASTSFADLAKLIG